MFNSLKSSLLSLVSLIGRNKREAETRIFIEEKLWKGEARRLDRLDYEYNCLREVVYYLTGGIMPPTSKEIGDVKICHYDNEDSLSRTKMTLTITSDWDGAYMCYYIHDESVNGGCGWGLVGHLRSKDLRDKNGNYIQNRVHAETILAQLRSHI